MAHIPADSQAILARWQQAPDDELLTADAEPPSVPDGPPFVFPWLGFARPPAPPETEADA